VEEVAVMATDLEILADELFAMLDEENAIWTDDESQSFELIADHLLFHTANEDFAKRNRTEIVESEFMFDPVGCIAALSSSFEDDGYGEDHFKWDANRRADAVARLLALADRIASYSPPTDCPQD